MSPVLAGVLLLAGLSAAQEPVVRQVRQARDLADAALYAADFYPPAPAPAADLPRFRYQYAQDLRPYADDDYTRSVDESSYQPYPAEYPPRYTNRALEKVLLDFLEDNGASKDESDEGINKRVLTSFRERMEREKSKEEHEKLAEMFLQKLQEEAEDRDVERDYDNRDYIEMIEDLWEKYKNSRHGDDSPYVEEIKKRQIPADYSTLGWSGVGYRKRSSSSELDSPTDGLIFLKIPTQKDDYDWVKPSQIDYNVQRSDAFRPYSPEYLYAKRKRFPVAKRSSNFYGNTKPVHHKRGANREQYYKKTPKNDSASGTDPKVMKDLSNIFGNKEQKKENVTASSLKTKKAMEKGKKISEKKSTVATATAIPVKDATLPSEVKHHHGSSGEHAKIEHKQQEKVSHGQIRDEPLNIKKKSIDWSNYFGIDRRKKKSESFSNDNDIDNDWLIKRYNKAVAMAVKRSSEYPLNFFRNHDSSKSTPDDEDNEEKPRKRTPESKSDESKLGDMDDKLKNIEDLIIDEALKYTGAHEGETDPKEVQEVKDKVISRLAAAYSLEKMRRALSEFKTSLAAQRYALKNKESGDPLELDDTSLAMKKKGTDSESRCTSKSGCEDNEYPSRSGNDLDMAGPGECDVIEHRCRSFTNEEHSAPFYSMCKWHQLCYLCNGEGSNQMNPLLSCDAEFLSQAVSLCQDSGPCQTAARRAMEYLREVQEQSPTSLSTQCARAVCDAAPAGFANARRR